MSAGESAHECGLAAGDWRQAAGGGGLCAMLLSFFALVFSRLKAKRGHGASQQRIGRLRDRGRGGGGAADARFGTRHNSVPSCRPRFASSADPSYAGVGADGARIATKKCCVFFFLASREPPVRESASSQVGAAGSRPKLRPVCLFATLPCSCCGCLSTLGPRATFQAAKLARSFDRASHRIDTAPLQTASVSSLATMPSRVGPHRCQLREHLV